MSRPMREQATIYVLPPPGTSFRAMGMTFLSLSEPRGFICEIGTGCWPHRAAWRTKQAYPGETAGKARHLLRLTFLLSCWWLCLEHGEQGVLQVGKERGLSVLEVSFPSPAGAPPAAKTSLPFRSLTKITVHEIISLRPTGDGGHMEIHSPLSGTALSQAVGHACAELRLTPVR